MGFLQNFCSIFPLDKETLERCQPFSCGDVDLDDFFLHDTENYSHQMLGKSYCYCLNGDPSVIVCAFTLANSSMDIRHLPGSRRKKVTALIPREKQLSSYPAVLVCRIGVNMAFRKKGIGSEMLDFIKSLAVQPDNWSSCRFLTVDAYNNERTRRYYQINGFKDLFSTEEQEKEYIGFPPEKELKTRLMYYDLMLLSDKM
ncbi:MAG: GNAT family N-acetyltransferase [Prevotellaceae bacterium]|jgi:GNAT superfamily N-acetyltransferase|nr:GNAT family N-acetyltransferase [Prevotellaceae bacterium]